MEDTKKKYIFKQKKCRAQFLSAFAALLTKIYEDAQHTARKQFPLLMANS